MPRSKNELDRDEMYKKLMPSLLRREEDPAAPPTPPLPPPPAGTTPILQLRARLLNRPADQPRKVVLANLLELEVAGRLDEAFAKFNCCKCDRCKKDAAALTLNQFPPRYAVAPAEDVAALDSGVPGREISAALVRAILQVRANPRH